MEKAATGIAGLDQITLGGLPRGRTTLVCGGPGCGKTLLGIEFVVRGARDLGEPGVFVSFEEPTGEVARNVASLGLALDELAGRDLLRLDHVRVEPGELATAGDFGLDGLMIRLDHAIREIGARRVVLDTLEALYSGLGDTALLRAEIRRLFGWLRERGVATVVTAERGDGPLTRSGLEEYVADCVILLDHRVEDEISTRRLRVVKYRGSLHGTNEYPFLIDPQGLTVLPVTSVGLDHGTSDQRVSSGVADLDGMLDGGFFRGSSVLVGGTPGTGKTSLAAHFAQSVCDAGGTCVYFAFEESPGQIQRNMRSIGLDLRPHVESGRLDIQAARPTLCGLEMHLVAMHQAIDSRRPDAVVVDPLSSLTAAGRREDAGRMTLRLVDHLKRRGITAFFTSLADPGRPLEATELGLSSLMDTWMLLREVEVCGERNREIFVLKSRGVRHSNQVREFVMSDAGIRLVPPYLGPAGPLTGSARVAQEARDREQEAERRILLERRRSEIERRSRALEAQIAALRADLEGAASEVAQLDTVERRRAEEQRRTRSLLAASRRADELPSPAGNGRRAEEAVS